MRFIFTLKNFLALFFLTMGGMMLRETYKERTVFFFSPDELGPMTYPRYLLWGWVGLSFVYLILPRRPADIKQIKASLPVLITTTVAVIGYIALFKYFGLFLSTLLFLLLFFYILDYRSPIKMVTIATATATISWLIFEKMLAIPMPESIIKNVFG